MSPNQIFSIVNLIALSGWVLLALMPRRRWAADIVAGVAIPLVLAVVYIAILATMWGGSSGGFSSLPAVGALFSNPWLLLAGWTHYLAFDLLIGGWEVRDAREHGLPQMLVLPCLALTFLFGPAGWLLYFVLRSALTASKPALRTE
ncbi:MAG: ABA4-like family protein [Vicinamibacterales bacterium]